ncbi:MAG: radical SAM protein [Candidatus Riflebacteria bacterium]|nr:radical SAM protein [Candidatus Riflebacteria bacterium]
MKIRVSYGTAICLGLLKATQDVEPTTGYLLYDTGCIGKCSFCSRANGNERSAKLSRIIWPEYEFETVLERLVQEPRPFSHICLQTGYNPNTEHLVKELALKLVNTGLSVSMTLSPSQPTLTLEMLSKGVDHVGIGLDAATPDGYGKHKRKVWETDWPNLKNTMQSAPNKIEVHLIFGLDESEEDFLYRIQEIVNSKGKVSLFAFTPVNGGNPPSIASYRRVQIFRYLCENGKIRYEDCNFENGQLKSVGIQGKELRNSLDKGDAFRTSGCNKCNRPYYNERPGQEFYNFPRPLSEAEFKEALLRSELFFDDSF